MTDLTVPPNDTALASVERLMAIGRQIEFAIPEDTDELWDVVIELENRAVINDAKRGLAYLTLKGRLPHGEFEAALEEKRISRFRAAESMRIASLLLKVTDENSNVRLGAHLDPAQLLALPKKKLLALAAIPEETFRELGEQGELDLDEVATMPLKDLRDYARKLKALRHTAEAEAKTLAEELSQARHEADTLRGHTHHRKAYPPSVTRARQDGSILADRALMAIDEIDALTKPWDSSTAEGYDLPAGDEGQAALTAGLGVLWFNLRAVQARAEKALTRLSEVYGESGLLPGGEEDLPLMNEAEARKVISTREAMFQAAKSDAAGREQARQARGEAPKKRGRPAGSKNKT